MPFRLSGFILVFSSGAMASFCSVCGGCVSSCTAGWLPLLPFPAQRCRQVSSVQAGLRHCRWSACSGLSWVSGLRLDLPAGLLGFPFPLQPAGQAAILQGKIGICNVHHQITGTGTIAAVLNANANGDLRIIPPGGKPPSWCSDSAYRAHRSRCVEVYRSCRRSAPDSWKFCR